MANDKIRLKIKNTLSYNMRVYVQDDELTVDKKTADSLVERNLAEVIGEEVGNENDSHVEDELDGLTVKELEEYAKEAGVNLKGLTRKGDIVKAIREAI